MTNERRHNDKLRKLIATGNMLKNYMEMEMRGTPVREENKQHLIDSWEKQIQEYRKRELLK